MVQYTVKRGDTLTAIPLKFGVPIELICHQNGIDNPNKIYAGQTLTIKQPSSQLLSDAFQVLFSYGPNMIKNALWRTTLGKLGGTVSAGIAALSGEKDGETVIKTIWCIVSATVTIVCPQVRVAVWAIDAAMLIADLVKAVKSADLSSLEQAVDATASSLQEAEGIKAWIAVLYSK